MVNQTSQPALRQLCESPFAGSAAAALVAAKAADRFYKGIYFNAAGDLEVVDSYGHSEVVTGGIGTVYPCSNCGAIAAGSTLTEGQFIYLYD